MFIVLVYRVVFCSNNLFLRPYLYDLLLRYMDLIKLAFWAILWLNIRGLWIGFCSILMVSCTHYTHRCGYTVLYMFRMVVTSPNMMEGDRQFCGRWKHTLATKPTSSICGCQAEDSFHALVSWTKPGALRHVVRRVGGSFHWNTAKKRITSAPKIQAYT